MKEYSYKTAAGREAACKEINQKIASLKAKLEPEKNKQSKLISENKTKIDARDSLNRQMKSKKSIGKTLIIVGVIAAAIGAAFVGVIGICAGILGIVLGIIVFNGWKKFQPEFNAADKELADFDQKNNSLSYTIRDYEKQINELENELSEIALAEKYEKVNNWIDSISTGHVVVYASSEMILADTHREPTAKLYDSATLTNVQVYVNDMLYGTLNGKYKTRNIDVFEVDESRTQKTEFVVNYHIGSAYNDYVTAPIPVKFDQKSLYCWFHVSSCGKGTKVFGQNYTSLEALMEDAGITKEELMKIFADRI